jgi:hypothetical protein
MSTDASTPDLAHGEETAAQTRRRVEALRMLRGQVRPVPIWIELATCVVFLFVFWLALRDGLSGGLRVAIGSMTVGLAGVMIHQARAIKRLDAAIELLLNLDHRSEPRRQA